MNDICGIIFIILVSMITDTRGHRHQQLLIISGDCLFHSCGNSFYWVSLTRRKFFNSEASKASSEKNHHNKELTLVLRKFCAMSKI